MLFYIFYLIYLFLNLNEKLKDILFRVKDDMSYLAYYTDDLLVAPIKLIEGVKSYPDRCLKVKYEDIVLETDKAIKKICKFLNINFSEDMLHYKGRAENGFKFGDSTGIYRDSRPNRDSLFRWKKSFQEENKKYLANSYLNSLGPYLIHKMGYDYDELKSSIEIPDHDSQKMFLWNTMVETHNKFYDKMYAQRVALSLLNTGVIKNDINSQYENWFNLVGKEVIRNQKKVQSELKNENLNYQKEVVSYQKEVLLFQKQIGLYQKEIESMKNTLSWKLTSPFRNWTLLKRIIQSVGKK